MNARLFLLLALLTVRAHAAVLGIDARAQAPAPETGYFHFGSATSPKDGALAVNSRYLTLDGKPFLPVMGEFHFTRFPNRYWKDELAKMKTAGIDIVSTYIFWNHHEEHEGRFLWSGDRDLRRFVTLCGALGLKVVIRPGPWVHSEARFGGIPDWVVHAMPVRGNDPVYLNYVRRYWSEVAKQVRGLLWKDGGPIVGMQLENEYNLSGPGQGREHISALKRIAVEAGLDVPLYTVTGWDNTLYPAREVTPLEGGYADQPWGLTTEKMAPAETYAFRFNSRVAGNLGAETRGAFMGDAAADSAHTPFLGAEFGGGVPAMYRRRPIMRPDDVAAMLPVELGSGVNLYGYYMFHGGQNSPDHGSLEENTSIGAYNDLPTIDYDFQAPLGAYGQQHAVLAKLRPFHYFLQSFGAALAPMSVHAPDILPKDSADLTTPRFSVRSAGDSGFLFMSNYVRQYPMAVQKDVRFAVQLPGGTMTFPSQPVDIPSGAYFVWPINLDLSGARLAYATVQPVARLGDLYVFHAIEGIPVELAIATDGVLSVAPANGRVTKDGGRFIVSGVHGLVSVSLSRGGDVKLLVLGAAEADRLSIATLEGRKRLILSDAQLFQDGEQLALLSTGAPDIAFSVFPRLSQAPSGSLPIREIAAGGSFQKFEATAPARSVAVSVTQTRKARDVPPLAMTGPSGTAVEPAPEIFGRSAAWEISIPKTALDGVEDAFLRIDARGDVGRLFSGATMLDDQFFNGATWEIGLKRFAAEIARPLTLTVLPMRRDAAIYLDRGVASMVSGEQTAEVVHVSVVPQYALRVGPRIGPTPKARAH
ncbi:MAG TPA: beta-galactosidase [Rhizomicrobium sp.]|nr:beta-galactosidase [Rhizomicrobium sp.]